MKKFDEKKRILIVSNNPISLTQNNGKTILSFIGDIPKSQIQQLFFSSEKPTIRGYSYFQLSDRDIISGYLFSSKRGKKYYKEIEDTTNLKNDLNESKIKVKKNTLMRIIREIIWFKHWKSKQLIEWLDDFKPNVVFFVAGDSGFAYDIVDFISKRYTARLISYITDDYIMPRKYENFLSQKRREYIKKKMLDCIKTSENYFTISSLMRDAYYKLSGKKSHLIMNITPSLKLDLKSDIKKELAQEIVFIYAGSLYYNRDKILGKIADAACKYNSQMEKGEKLVKIKVYSNFIPDNKVKAVFERENCCKFYGSLNYEELKIEYNKADILLFVESFDLEMQEKTKYSLSTKVPEYMSLEKPIFAVGPKDIGSMDYLRDISFSVYSEDQIYDVMKEMLISKEQRRIKAKMSLDKFLKYHNINEKKKEFMGICLK